MINNMPEYANNYDFIVYRVIAGEKWFYGAYSDHDRANNIAKEIGGYVA